MKLSSYNRRRKMALGGPTDPPRWIKKPTGQYQFAPKNMYGFVKNSKGNFIPEQGVKGFSTPGTVKPANIPKTGAVKNFARNAGKFAKTPLGKINLLGAVLGGYETATQLTGSTPGDEVMRWWRNRNHRENAESENQLKQQGLLENKLYYDMFPQGILTGIGSDNNQESAQPAPQESPDTPSPSTPSTPVDTPRMRAIERASTNGLLEEASLPEGPSMAPDTRFPERTGGMEEVGQFVAENQKVGTDWKAIGETALQFLPEAVNLATGLFSKDKTPPATRVDKSAVNKMPRKYNINPMLRSNAKSFRAILSDPNATTNQKIAAMAMKQNADQVAYAEKMNQEAQMQSNRASVEANLDSQQARYDSQAREDKMASDANRGIGGNFARQALAGMSTKALQIIRQNNLQKADQATIRAVLAGVDPNIAQEILNSMK